MDIYCAICNKHIAKLAGSVRNGAKISGQCEECQERQTLYKTKNEAFLPDEFKDLFRSFRKHKY